MTVQIAIRLPDELVAAVDELVAGGDVENRTDAVRSALELYVREAIRRKTDDEMVRGYTAIPPGGVDAWGSLDAMSSSPRRARQELDRSDGGW